MPLRNIQEIDVFDCWGIDFIGPLPSSLSNKYILLAVEYVSRWVEGIPTQKADSKTMIKFVKKHIFCRFGTPRVLISDGGACFCNVQLKKVLEHYGIKHRIATTYHPQSNGQAKVSNKEINKILEKTIATLRKDCAMKLDEALWTYITTYKRPTPLSPFQLIYGKTCHLLVKLEHRAFWALKWVNFDSKASAEKRMLQLNELEEMRLNAYNSSRLYKESVKAYHDKKLLEREFHPGQLVLLFNSRLRLFLRKLKSRWSGPFVVKQVKPHGVVEIKDAKSKRSWLVNGQRLKHYKGGEVQGFIVVITLSD